MNDKNKKIVLFLGTVLVAVIFLSAYASFNNNNVSNSSTSTIKNPQTFPSFGNSNAVISSYGNIVNITFSGNSNASVNATAALLSNLESKGAVNNYFYSGNRYEAILSNITAYQLRQMVYNITNQSNSISVGSVAYLKFPGTVTLYYVGTPVNLYLANKNYSIYMKNVKSIGSTVNVKVFALLTKNGSIYNNQLIINYSG